MKNFLQRTGVVPLIVLGLVVLLFARGIAGHFLGPKTYGEQEAQAAADLPRGVLHYSDCPGPHCARPGTVTCLSAEQLQRKTNHQPPLVTAQLDDGRTLQIYAPGDGTFLALSVGADKAGVPEACVITAGKNLQLGAAAAAAPAPAAAPVAAIPETPPIAPTVPLVGAPPVAPAPPPPAPVSAAPVIAAPAPPAAIPAAPSPAPAAGIVPGQAP